MFDIGFGELLVVGAVALVVLGPERLPVVARTAGLWVGKARNMLAGVKAEIDRELKAEDLKRALEEQAKTASLYEMVEETKSTLDETKSALKDAVEEVQGVKQQVAEGEPLPEQRMTQHSPEHTNEKSPHRLPDDNG